MPKLEFSERFTDDLAAVSSPKIEGKINVALDNIEAFMDFGSANVPKSIRQRFEGNIRKVAVNPFTLIYTAYPDEDKVRVEALIPQRSAR